MIVKPPPMNCLVIGKAKTGTTALAHLLQSELDAKILHMEPKGIKDYLPAIPEDGGYVTKIIFEHFRGRFRHLNAIVHNELYAHYHKVVFIRRDIRDEMLSRLLYLAKIISSADHSDEAWRQWVDALREKESNPGAVSFHQLCDTFQSIFGANAWRDITNLHTDTERDFNAFISNSVKRDFLVVSYEDLVDNRVDTLSEYIGFPLSGGFSNVELGKYAYTRRSGKHGGWRSFFVPQDVEEIRTTLERKGLNRFEDWELDANPQLAPEDLSEYVIRMSNRPDRIFR